VNELNLFLFTKGQFILFQKKYQKKYNCCYLTQNQYKKKRNQLNFDGILQGIACIPQGMQ